MLPGIDVSMYQGVIIWKDVRAAGYEFAGLKATEGSLWRDPQFDRNWNRCEVRGIKKCGIYIYTNKYFWDGLLGAPQSRILGRCALWDASWGAYPSAPANWASGASIWQWTEKLTVPGINGYVDGDRFLGTMQQYNTLAAKSGRE